MTKKSKVEHVVLAQDEISKLVQERVKLETKEEINAALSKEGRIDFWGQVRSIAEECDQVLLKAGYPRAWQAILADSSGNWRDFSGNPRDASGGWKWTRGHNLVLEATRDFSDLWYAARVGEKAGIALENFERGRGYESHLFVLIWEIATLMADWRWRALHKKQIVTGKKQRSNLHELRETNNQAAKRQAEERRVIVAELMAETSLTGGSLDNWLSKQMKLRHGISFRPRTYREDRKILKRHSK